MEHVTFYLLESLIRTTTSNQRIKERKLQFVGTVPIKCRLPHRIVEVVVDLDESMAGLHFLCTYKVRAACQRRRHINLKSK